MTLEISLRPPFSLSRVLRAQDDDARQHWVGQAPATSQNKPVQGNQGKNQQQGNNERGYRPLAEIGLGEVKAAYKQFEYQLIPAQENWIGENCFCTIPLKRIRDGRPPMVFGRVTSCFPSDGYVENIEEVELLFPRGKGASDRIRIYKDDISQYSQRLAQSFYIRVRFKATEEYAVDFAGADPLFSENGFYPEFDPGYYDLLEMNDHNQSKSPWMYVVDSRWFTSVPDSIYAEVKAKLREMLQWHKQIFNYHPDWLPKEVNTLNKVLGYKHEFTPILLTEPATPQETAFIVAKIFDRDIFPSAKTEK